MYKTILAASLTLSLLYLHPVKAAAPPSDLTSAHKLMMSGKYAEAVPLFNKALKGAAKNNALAHYYYAACLSQLGKTVEANVEYRLTLSLNPPAAIASYCHQALGTKPSATSSAATGQTAGESGGGHPTTRQPGPSESAAASASKQIDPLDKPMVTIHRHTQDTDEIYNNVLSALSVVPRKIKDDVKGAGCKILVCPTILEANPHLANTKAAGYVHGGGYDNCPGMFYSGTKILYIAERAAWQSSPPQLNWMAASTTLHELGHAYDYAKSGISDSHEFEELYKGDYDRLTNSERTKWQYYCQDEGGERGRSELFAELFAIAHGTAGGIDKGSGGLVNVFPHCYSYIKSIAH